MTIYIINFAVAGYPCYKAFTDLLLAAERLQTLADFATNTGNEDILEVDTNIKEHHINTPAELVDLLDALRAQPDMDQLDLGVYSSKSTASLN